jgi:hypothetical protein
MMLVLPNTNAAIKKPVVTPRYVRPDALWKIHIDPEICASEVKIKFIVPETIEMIREQAIITGERTVASAVSLPFETTYQRGLAL